MARSINVWEEYQISIREAYETLPIQKFVRRLYHAFGYDYNFLGVIIEEKETKEKWVMLHLQQTYAYDTTWVVDGMGIAPWKEVVDAKEKGGGRVFPEDLPRYRFVEGSDLGENFQIPVGHPPFMNGTVTTAWTIE